MKPNSAPGTEVLTVTFLAGSLFELSTVISNSGDFSFLQAMVSEERKRTKKGRVYFFILLPVLLTNNRKLNYILFKKTCLIICLALFALEIQAQERVKIVTNKGIIIVKLYEDTPIHRENFLKLAKKGYYDSTSFHRVIKDFMIQGGDPQSIPKSGADKVGSGGPGYTLEAELNKGHIHKKGALAAARQPDQLNPQKRSSGSQFYIVVGRKYPSQYLFPFERDNGITYTREQKEVYEKQGGTPHLDGGYTVFGEVLKGMPIVEEISQVETGKGDRPTKPIYILKMEVL